MKYFLPIFLIFALFLTGCEKNTFDPDSDPLYPTIIRKLSSGQISQLRSSYSQQNIYLHSSLNEFGFCDGSELDYIPPSPPPDTTVSRLEALGIAKKFVAKNSQFTGITDTNDLQFTNVDKMSDYWDGSTTGWHLRSAFQRADTIDVMTQIYILMKGREVYYCIGNWFPEIYVPAKINFDAAGARQRLLFMSVSHWGWDGEHKVVITPEPLEESTAKLYIVPVSKPDCIELRLAWCIDIPAPVYYVIYVDAITGEIIRKGPTIVSINTTGND